MLASALTACGQVWFMWDQVAHWACLAWLIFNWLSMGLIYGLQKWLAPTRSVQQQAWMQIGCMGLLGLVWGSSITVAAAFGTNQAMVYALVVVGGVNSGALGICAALLPASLAYVAAMAGLLLVGVLGFSDPSFAPLAVLVGIYVVMTTFQAINAQEAAVRTINQKLQNVGLVEQLRSESAQALAAKQAAEQANQDKSRFLAAASHDLRQPLHAMGLFVEALARSPLTPEQTHVLTHLRSASDSTREMLNTLLDYSRLEAGAVQVNPKAFALQKLLTKLEQEFAMQADTQDLLYRMRETTLAVYADPTLVDLVLRNLVSNALRYTLSGGVLVACRPRGEQVAVQVWDTGLGIAPQDRLAVFKEFYQVGNPERDRRKGLGLGLAIVRRLCGAMGAQVNLCSVLGKGSMFELVLPRSSGVLISDISANEAAKASPQFQGLRVMVIDDEAPVRQGMQSLLTVWGCDCTSFESAADALLLWLIKRLKNCRKYCSATIACATISQARRRLLMYAPPARNVACRASCPPSSSQVTPAPSVSARRSAQTRCCCTNPSALRLCKML
jgi:signal transduction histidine kinase